MLESFEHPFETAPQSIVSSFHDREVLVQDVVQKIRSTQVLAATFLFGSALAGVTVDEIENRVSQPAFERCTSSYTDTMDKVSSPFEGRSGA